MMKIEEMGHLGMRVLHFHLATTPASSKVLTMLISGLLHLIDVEVVTRRYPSLRDTSINKERHCMISYKRYWFDSTLCKYKKE